MQPFQSRVIAERRDLDAKIAKLQTFIQEGTYQSLPSDERGRLAHQLAVMKEYSEILTQRIHAFGPLEFVIMVNGEHKRLKEPRLSYEQLVELAGLTGNPSCTYGYIGEQNAGGIFCPGDTLQIVGNEHFSIVHTGNA